MIDIWNTFVSEILSYLPNWIPWENLLINKKP